MKKEVSSPQTKYIPLNVCCLINYRNVLCHVPLATTSQTEKERIRQKQRVKNMKKWQKEKREEGKKLGRNREETYLTAFICSFLFPASLLRADMPSCLSYFALHPRAEVDNRLAMLSKGEGRSDQCKQAPGTSSCKPTETYSWIPPACRDLRKAFLLCVPSKATLSYA